MIICSFSFILSLVSLHRPSFYILWLFFILYPRCVIDLFFPKLIICSLSFLNWLLFNFLKLIICSLSFYIICILFYPRCVIDLGGLNCCCEIRVVQLVWQELSRNYEWKKGKSGEFSLESKSQIYCVQKRVLNGLIIRMKNVRDFYEVILTLFYRKHVQQQ